jgi:hypothetical protein
MPLEYRTCECLAIPGDTISQALLFAGQMTNVARRQIPGLMLSAMHIGLVAVVVQDAGNRWDLIGPAA